MKTPPQILIAIALGLTFSCPPRAAAGTRDLPVQQSLVPLTVDTIVPIQNMMARQMGFLKNLPPEIALARLRTQSLFPGLPALQQESARALLSMAASPVFPALKAGDPLYEALVRQWGPENIASAQAAAAKIHQAAPNDPGLAATLYRFESEILPLARVAEPTETQVRLDQAFSGSKSRPGLAEPAAPAVETAPQAKAEPYEIRSIVIDAQHKWGSEVTYPKVEAHGERHLARRLAEAFIRAGVKASVGIRSNSKGNEPKESEIELAKPGAAIDAAKPIDLLIIPASDPLILTLQQKSPKDEDAPGLVKILLPLVGKDNDNLPHAKSWAGENPADQNVEGYVHVAGQSAPLSSLIDPLEGKVEYPLDELDVRIDAVAREILAVARLARAAADGGWSVKDVLGAHSAGNEFLKVPVSPKVEAPTVPAVAAAAKTPEGGGYAAHLERKLGEFRRLRIQRVVIIGALIIALMAFLYRPDTRILAVPTAFMIAAGLHTLLRVLPRRIRETEKLLREIRR